MGAASEEESDSDKSDDLIRFIWGTTERWLDGPEP